MLYPTTQPRPPYEYGDLSGKHGKLNATSGSGGSFVRTGQAVVMDATLPLSGAYSVLGYVWRSARPRRQIIFYQIIARSLPDHYQIIARSLPDHSQIMPQGSLCSSPLRL